MLYSPVSFKILNEVEKSGISLNTLKIPVRERWISSTELLESLRGEKPTKSNSCSLGLLIMNFVP